jgi:hypothetical protein
VTRNSLRAVSSLRTPRLRRSVQNADALCRTAVLFFIQNTPKEKGPPMGALCLLARPERFELPTAWFVARYSIQLSYGRNVWFRAPRRAPTKAIRAPVARGHPARAAHITVPGCSRKGRQAVNPPFRRGRDARPAARRTAVPPVPRPACSAPPPVRPAAAPPSAEPPSCSGRKAAP